MARLPAWTLVVALALYGCASAQPVLSGGSTTPHLRTDLAAGGVARIPFGKLRNDVNGEPSGYREAAEAGGVLPLIFFRRGLSNGRDVGVLVTASDARLDLRKERLLSGGTTRTSFVFGVSPSAGWITERSGSGRGRRASVEVPLIYGVDFGGVYEVWVGGRAGVEYAGGRFVLSNTKRNANAIGTRVGAVLGMAAGFRRIHALVEVTAAYEQWFVDHGAQSLNRGGLVLIPAFAIRLRI